jgi:hypothetical protein
MYGAGSDLLDRHCSGSLTGRLRARICDQRRFGMTMELPAQSGFRWTHPDCSGLHDACSHRGGQGFKSPQLHPLDLVSDLVRGSLLEPQPTSVAGAFGVVGRNLGDHLLPVPGCRRLLDGLAWRRSLAERRQKLVEECYLAGATPPLGQVMLIDRTRVKRQNCNHQWLRDARMGRHGPKRSTQVQIVQRDSRKIS